MRKINIHCLFLFVLLAAGSFSIAFPTDTRADSCPLFSETFSGPSGNTWYCGANGVCTITNGRFELTQPVSGKYSYGQTNFLPTGFFTSSKHCSIYQRSPLSQTSVLSRIAKEVKKLYPKFMFLPYNHEKQQMRKI